MNNQLHYPGVIHKIFLLEAPQARSTKVYKCLNPAEVPELYTLKSV